MLSVSWDRVLVLQTSFIGDTVLTLPLLSEIKRRQPGARLSFFCTPQGQELARNCAAVDEIIVDDKRGEHRGLSGLWRQALRLRQKNFSLALTPHKSLRSALILFLARIPAASAFARVRVGFSFTSGCNGAPSCMTSSATCRCSKRSASHRQSARAITACAYSIVPGRRSRNSAT
jgi:ADP-heptose:LPS heptosyltransferase